MRALPRRHRLRFDMVLRHPGFEQRHGGDLAGEMADEPDPAPRADSHVIRSAMSLQSRTRVSECAPARRHIGYARRS